MQIINHFAFFSGYFTLITILYLLIKDNPFSKFLTLGKEIKWFKWVIVIFGLIHIIGVLPELGFSKIISGVFLFGLTIIYTLAGKYSGIEDRIARSIFKKISWLLIIILFFVHVIYL